MVSLRDARFQAAYEHNGERVTAEAFYAIACDPRRSVAVEACAGAGKTWILVSRMVRALFEGLDGDGGLQVQPHEILAITFTKRAASEMRERLYQWLREFASASDQRLLQELRDRGVVMPNQSQAAFIMSGRLSNLYQSLLTNGREVQIRTFHSWFAALLASAPLAVLQRMGLPDNYELLEDDSQAREQVWRRFYAALARSEPQSANLKTDFEAVVLEYGRSQTQRALQNALDKRTEFDLADARGVVDASVQTFDQQDPGLVGVAAPQDYLRSDARRWQILVDAAAALGRASTKTFSAKGAELEMALASASFDAMFDALMTKAGEARKFNDNIEGIAAVREAQALMARVRSACAQHAAWRYQQRMARLTRLLLGEYGALKRDRGWVDMNDVERAALFMLGDPVLSGWVQERLDARIKHLLVDEFQDTNPLQWQAIKCWLAGYSGAGGAVPSVFIVGDPKQSIYRFRRAEPQVFESAKNFVRQALGGAVLSCDHTRRNATAIIATVNTVMGEAAQSDGYPGFRAHTTSSLEAGLVCKLPAIARPQESALGSDTLTWRDSLCTPRELPEETLRTHEARQAAAWLAAQLATTDLQAANVMVLARKRAALLPMQDELRRLQVAAQIGEKTSLIDCCEVRDVVALLDVLVSPQHDLSLARVLKSPLFGLGDEALVHMAQARAQTPLTWYELLQKTELSTVDGRSPAACLIRWKGWLDRLPPHDALQGIYTDGDVLARFCVAAPSHQRATVLTNLRALLALSLRVGGGRYATPYALVRALKSGNVLAPAAVNPQAVRLLTIHGAKGLEAHTVLLLDTDTSERNADSMTVLVDWPFDASWPNKFIFLASESRPPSCAVVALNAERMQRAREELNALYVAMTRSRHTLTISSVEPFRDAPHSWWQRLQALAHPPVVGALAAPDLLVASVRGGSFHLAELPAVLVDKAVAVIKSEANGLTARIGEAMHRLLQWGDLSVSNTLAVAREFDLTSEQAAHANAMAGRIFQGEGAWAWDPRVLAWQGNEVELMVQGHACRLDRLVQRQDGGHVGEWWVLDYKSSTTPQTDGNLVAQLLAYQSAVRDINGGTPVRAAFLTSAGALIEVVNPSE